VIPFDELKLRTAIMERLARRVAEAGGFLSRAELSPDPPALIS
jgi:hypothetical protein